MSKTILDFPETTVSQPGDFLYTVRGTGAGRDRRVQAGVVQVTHLLPFYPASDADYYLSDCVGSVFLPIAMTLDAEPPKVVTLLGTLPVNKILTILNIGNIDLSLKTVVPEDLGYVLQPGEMLNLWWTDLAELPLYNVVAGSLYGNITALNNLRSRAMESDTLDDGPVMVNQAGTLQRGLAIRPFTDFNDLISEGSTGFYQCFAAGPGFYAQNAPVMTTNKNWFCENTVMPFLDPAGVQVPGCYYIHQRAWEASNVSDVPMYQRLGLIVDPDPLVWDSWVEISGGGGGGGLTTVAHDLTMTGTGESGSPLKGPIIRVTSEAELRAALALALTEKDLWLLSPQTMNAATSASQDIRGINRLHGALLTVSGTQALGTTGNPWSIYNLGHLAFGGAGTLTINGGVSWKTRRLTSGVAMTLQGVNPETVLFVYEKINTGGTVPTAGAFAQVSRSGWDGTIVPDADNDFQAAQSATVDHGSNTGGTLAAWISVIKTSAATVLDTFGVRHSFRALINGTINYYGGVRAYQKGAGGRMALTYCADKSSSAETEALSASADGITIPKPLVGTEQAATPATLAAGLVQVYPKTDKRMYALDSDGKETPIGDTLIFSNAGVTLAASKWYKIGASSGGVDWTGLLTIFAGSYRVTLAASFESTKVGTLHVLAASYDPADQRILKFKQCDGALWVLTGAAIMSAVRAEWSNCSGLRYTTPSVWTWDMVTNQAAATVPTGSSVNTLVDLTYTNSSVVLPSSAKLVTPATAAGDAATTLTTKGYVDAAVAACASGGNPQYKFVDYTILSTDGSIVGNSSGTPLIFTLEAAPSVGREVVIVNVGLAALTVHEPGGSGFGIWQSAADVNIPSNTAITFKFVQLGAASWTWVTL